MTCLTRHACVLTHVPFEDLGSLQPVLEQRGFAVDFAEAPCSQFPLPSADLCDLLIVMGGPIGVYDTADYPFLSAEIELIRQRLDAGKPILGICLGSQLIAAALGARVYPGSAGSEIGWKSLAAANGDTPAWFAPLLEPGLKLLHWHGDTFDLPQGAMRLAETDLYENQAFTIGNNALALQFHPEVTAEGLERWYVGHAAELNQKKISVAALRADGLRNAPLLAEAAKRFCNLWLDYIL